MDNIKNKVISGVKWTSLDRYSSLIINLVGGIYLARTISPEVFGQVGLMIAIIGFVAMGSMWGSAAALMKRPGKVEDNLEYASTLLTIDVAISSVTLIVLLIVALFFPKSMGFIMLVMVLSKAPMLFTKVYRASIIKDMVFHRYFIIHFVSSFISVGLACFLAYRGFGLWALVLKYSVENLCTGTLSFVLSINRLKFKFNKEMAKDFFNFGKFAFVSSTLEGGRTHIDRISLGSYIGPAALGFYGRAHSFLLYVNTLFWDATGLVFQSLFGNLKDQRTRLSKVYNIGSSFFFRIYLIVFIWLGLLIPELITIVYGEKWLPTVPIFRLLIPFFVLTSLRQLNHSLQLYTGHSKVVAKIKIIELVSFILCLFPLMFLFKIKGVVLSLNISIFLGAIFYIMSARKIVDVNLKEIFLMPIAISVITLICFLSFKNIAGQIDNIYMHVLLNSVLIFGTYFALSVVFEYNFIKNIVQLIMVKGNE